MDRGVFIGGGLICASFLLAVLLNESAHKVPLDPEPPKATEVEHGPVKCEPPSPRAPAPEGQLPRAKRPALEGAGDESKCK